MEWARKILWAARWPLAILAPYSVGLVGFFTIGAPIWPTQILSVAIAAFKNWRVALVLAVPVLLFQWVKIEIHLDEVWAYYASIYLALGVCSFAFFDKRVIAPAAFVIAAFYALEYFGQPRAILDGGTEGAWYVALIVGVLLGPSGGIFSRSWGSSGTAAMGGGMRPNRVSLRSWLSGRWRTNRGRGLAGKVGVAKDSG